MAAQAAAYRAGGGRERDLPQAGHSGGAGLLEGTGGGLDGEFPDPAADLEAGRFQDRPVGGEDGLRPVRGKEPEQHEGVRHGFQAEARDGERVTGLRLGQRGSQGTEAGLRILHASSLGRKGCFDED